VLIKEQDELEDEDRDDRKLEDRRDDLITCGLVAVSGRYGTSR
jgi:hypothetical protein